MSVITINVPSRSIPAEPLPALRATVRTLADKLSAKNWKQVKAELAG